MALATFSLQVSAFDIGAEDNQTRENMLPQQLITVAGNDIVPCMLQNTGQNYTFDEANSLIHFDVGSLNDVYQVAEQPYTRWAADCHPETSNNSLGNNKYKVDLVLSNGMELTKDYFWRYLYEENTYINSIPSISIGVEDTGGIYRSTFSTQDTIGIVVDYELLAPRELITGKYEIKTYFVLQLDNDWYQYTQNGFEPFTGVDNLKPYHDCTTHEYFDNRHHYPVKDLPLTDLAKTYSSLKLYAGAAYCDGAFRVNPELDNVLMFNPKPTEVTFYEPDLTQTAEVQTVYYNSRKNKVWYTETVVDGIRHGTMKAYEFHDQNKVFYEAEYYYGTKTKRTEYPTVFSPYKKISYYNKEYGIGYRFELYDENNQLIEVRETKEYNENGNPIKAVYSYVEYENGQQVYTPASVTIYSYDENEKQSIEERYLCSRPGVTCE